MTYILEKQYVVNPNGKISPYEYGHLIIRPCGLDYKTLLKFIKGEVKHPTEVVFGGQIAHLDFSSNDGKLLEFDSVEEWLIMLELERGIAPDFENIHYRSYSAFNDYTAKIIDLHTNEVIYDATEKVLQQLINMTKLTKQL